MPVTLKAIIKGRANADNTHTVFVRITKDRDYIVHSAGVRIDKKHWNEKGNYEKRNWIRATLGNSEQQNVTIKKIIDKVTDITSKDPDVTLAQIGIKISGKSDYDFIQFWKDDMIQRNLRLSPTSRDKYKSQINNFIAFTKNKPVPFSDLTYQFIQKYYAWMLTENKAESTALKAMAFLRTIVIESVKSGYIKHAENPFLYFKIKEYKVNKVRLNSDEILIFETKEAKTITMQASVHLFLMQYYNAGARVSDVIQMRWEDVINDRWFYTMGKTDRMKNIKLSTKALEILKIYGYGIKKTGYVFPFLTAENVKAAGDRFHKKIQSVTAQVNFNIKEFALINEINKTISTHTARHSFADAARKISGDVYAISKALGHSKISTTEKYLASLDDGSVDELMDKINL